MVVLDLQVCVAESQYWPDGQVVAVLDLQVCVTESHHWPDGQVVVVELTQLVPFQY